MADDKSEHKEVLATNLQGWSIQDGPGIRTTVFLKGCPLRCAWCHNPETQLTHAEIYYKKMKCTQCGKCLAVCPEGAIYPPIDPAEANQEGNKYYKINLERCNHCMKCVDVCLYGALEKIGTPMSIDEVSHEVERELPFYLNSGGGLTLSGGDPTVHPEWCLELLKRVKNSVGVHTCMETCGYCKFDVLKQFIPLIDLFLYDIKHMDSAKHKEATGVPNELILENAKKLAENGATLRLRLPIIPDYNDSEEHMEQVAAFAQSLGAAVEGIDLLPFHNYCDQKYRWLGNMEWPLAEVEALTKAELGPLEDILKEHGIETTIGG